MIARSCVFLAVLFLTACGGGSSGSDGVISPPPGDAGGNTDPPASVDSFSTAGVLCDYAHNVFNDDESVNTTSDATWSCNDQERSLNGNGVPDHEVGTFPNEGNPNQIAQQNIQINFPLEPSLVSDEGESARTVGYALNSVKFEPGTAGSCSSDTNCSLRDPSGGWSIEALGQTAFDFGDDMNNAHVQPTGAYHYHGMPERFLEVLGANESITLVGWALDGFPLYARYGYADAEDAESEIKVLTSSWRLKEAPDSGRPDVELYEMGTFSQDFEYVEGSGDLDECNGRRGVTPEFPDGIYYLLVTDSFPFIGRCLKGEFEQSQGPP
jgi:hypothetical protein